MGHHPSDGTDLTGQVAIVTGGGRGIGRAIAIGLADSGASVTVVARTADQIAETASRIAQAGGRAIAVPADVSDPEAVQRMFQEGERTWGPVDLLVNKAGLAGPIGPTWEADPGEWWRCLEVNLRGPIRLPCRANPWLLLGHRSLWANPAGRNARLATPLHYDTASLTER